MNGCEQLVAWANVEPDDFVRSAVRNAYCLATDNVAGDDEHAVFVNALLAGLGLKRPNRRPKKSIATGPLALALVMKPHDVSDHQIAKAVSEISDMAPNTVRARMSEVSKVLAEGRELFAAAMPLVGRKRSVW